MGNIPKSRLLLMGGGVFLVIFAILIFTGLIPGLKSTSSKPDPNAIPSVNLSVWGVYDTKKIMTQVVSAGQAGSITYRQMNPATYEDDFLKALALGQGPDVFMVHSSWLPKKFDIMAGASTAQFSLQSLETLFPRVVEQDFTAKGKVYALPLYLDTLALFYNKEIFDQNGLVEPPKTWTDFEQLIPTLREVDLTNNKITKAAAAIGGSGKTINRESDIISLLMLQSGVTMTDAKFRGASFSQSGLAPLRYYLKFSDPKSRVYTWNDGLNYSVDWFSEKKAAMMFNYSFAIDLLKKKNQFLRYGVSPMLQPGGSKPEVNYASYWGLAVSNKSKNQRAAWNFITKLTTSQAGMERYSKLTGRPPALRALIEKYKNDPQLGVFVQQALTARSWLQVDHERIDVIFSDMVDSVLTGELDAGKALKRAAQTITAMIQQQKKFTP